MVRIQFIRLLLKKHGIAHFNTFMPLSHIPFEKEVHFVLLGRCTGRSICRPSVLSSLSFDLFASEFVCLFVCLGFSIQLENFSLICKTYHCRKRAANVDICSALMAIEQWGFSSVLHLLCHGESVYNGHLGGPVTLTPNAERLAVELSLPVLKLSLIHIWRCRRYAVCRSRWSPYH